MDTPLPVYRQRGHLLSSLSDDCTHFEITLVSRKSLTHIGHRRHRPSGRPLVVLRAPGELEVGVFPCLSGGDLGVNCSNSGSANEKRTGAYEVDASRRHK